MGMGRQQEETPLVSWHLSRDLRDVQEGDLDERGRGFQAVRTPGSKASSEESPWPELSI